MKYTSPIKLFYDIYLFSIVVTVNVFFLLFVYNKHDLSPNLALLVVTFPIIIIQLMKIINYIRIPKSVKE